MNKRNLVLFRTLLLSTSAWNKIKYTEDKKSKGNVIGNLIGMSVLYLMIMTYSILNCIGYGRIGLTEIIPAMCGMLISVVAFVFTIFKTNGYLFHFKEYDMLMSLPYEPKTIAACKFLYMYVKSLPWFVSLSMAMLIGYTIYTGFSLLTWIVWILSTFVLPVIPMLAASFIGYLIARISVHFRKTNIVQTILMFGIVILAFGSRFIIESIFRNGNVEVVLENMGNQVQNTVRMYPPVKWFCDAVLKGNVLYFLLLVAASAILFEVIFIPVGRSYRKINSALKSHAAAKDFKMTKQKKRSVVQTIAFKEFRRLVGSTNYMVNCGIGQVLSVIMGVAVLIVGFDKLIGVVTNGAPIPTEMLFPAIPLIGYFLVGMMSTTACSPSLEGKNYWIVQSLPISKKTLYQGKMLFNLYFTVPFLEFSVLCICISAQVPLLNTLLYAVEGLTLCTFSTTWGCVCGVKYRKLEWENEIEVIKQGAAVAIYMFPNMFVTMILIVLVVVLGQWVDSNIVTLILIVITAGLSAVCYRIVTNLKE